VIKYIVATKCFVLNEFLYVRLAPGWVGVIDINVLLFFYNQLIEAYSKSE
jgi:hypothetical protein